MATRREDAQEGEGECTDSLDTSTREEVLDSTLVTNTDGPDRRTVFPRGLTSVARMSTWLTANESVFVDVEENR